MKSPPSFPEATSRRRNPKAAKRNFRQEPTQPFCCCLADFHRFLLFFLTTTSQTSKPSKKLQTHQNPRKKLEKHKLILLFGGQTVAAVVAAPAAARRYNQREDHHDFDARPLRRWSPHPSHFHKSGSPPITPENYPGASGWCQTVAAVATGDLEPGSVSLIPLSTDPFEVQADKTFQAGQGTSDTPLSISRIRSTSLSSTTTTMATCRSRKSET